MPQHVSRGWRAGGDGGVRSMRCPAASAPWSRRQVGAGAHFLQRSYRSGFHLSGVQGSACLGTQAPRCAGRLWGVGTVSSTKTLWYGAVATMMREGDGRGGSQGSAPPVEPCAQCLCPCSSPVRVVASKTNAAPGPPPATVMAWTILHRGPLPAGGVTHGPSSARYQGHGPAWCCCTQVAARATAGRCRLPSGGRVALC